MFKGILIFLVGEMAPKSRAVFKALESLFSNYFNHFKALNYLKHSLVPYGSLSFCFKKDF